MLRTQESIVTWTDPEMQVFTTLPTTQRLARASLVATQVLDMAAELPQEQDTGAEQQLQEQDTAPLTLQLDHTV